MTAKKKKTASKKVGEPAKPSPKAVKDIPAEVPVEAITHFTGLGKERIYQLGRDGVMRQIGKGRWALAESVLGYIEFLRSGASGTKASVKEKIEITKWQREKLKLARERGQQIHKGLAQQVWSEVLVRLSQHVQYMDGMTRPQATKLCKLLRAEAERIVDELEKCTFDEAEGDEEGDDEED